MPTDETKSSIPEVNVTQFFTFQQFLVKYDCMFFLALPPSVQLSHHSSSGSNRKWGQIHQWMVGERESVAASHSTNMACCVGLSPGQP